MNSAPAAALAASIERDQQQGAGRWTAPEPSATAVTAPR